MSDDDTAATILVVEDDSATRAFLADNLIADGFLVVGAPGVRKGLELLGTAYPDLVLVDVHLPDGSGLELVRTVRAAESLGSGVDPRTPMLVLSGRAGELDRLRAFEQGCDDFLPKPYSYPELRASISSTGRDGRILISSTGPATKASFGGARDRVAVSDPLTPAFQRTRKYRAGGTSALRGMRARALGRSPMTALRPERE